MARAQAKYEITAVDRASRVLRRLKGNFAKFGRTVGRVGGLFGGIGVAGVGAFANALSKSDDKIAKFSKAIGTTPEFLSQLAFAADLSGSSFSSLTVGFRKMASTLDDATGDELLSAQRTFGKLHLDFKKIQELRPEQAFFRIANALKKVENPLEKAAIAQEIFGRQGVDMIPLLDQGSKGMQKMMREADALGITLSSADAASAESFQDSIVKLTQAFRPLGRALVDLIVPALEMMVGLIKQIRGEGLEKTVKKVAKVAQTAGRNAGILGPGSLSGMTTDQRARRDAGAAAMRRNLPSALMAGLSKHFAMNFSGGPDGGFLAGYRASQAAAKEQGTAGFDASGGKTIIVLERTMHAVESIATKGAPAVAQ